MSGRVRNGVLAASVVVLFAAAAASIYYWKFGRAVSPESLLAGLPGKDGAVVYLDVRALRVAGVLDSVGGAAGAEEPDYKAFVAVTKFNYREDLDAVAAAYRDGDVYILAAGRFDWASLRNYALTQSGKCTDDLCRMASSQPGRTITFFLKSSGVMALSVSNRADAAAAFRQSQPVFAGAVSKQPMWISLPGALLKGDEKVPSGTRLFAKILESTQRVSFAFGTRGTAFEISMDAVCVSDKDAEAALNQFDGVTEVMRKYIARVNKTPGPDELAGVLMGGVFHREGTRVIGTWPVERAFLNNLTGGSR